MFLRRWALGLVVLCHLSAAQAAMDVSRLHKALDEQQYAVVQSDLDALLRVPKPGAVQREVIYRWLFARDNGAEVDRRTKGALDDAQADAVDLLAAGRLALERRDLERARLSFERALEWATRPAERAQALRGLGQRHYQLREFDASLLKLEQSVATVATADGLAALAETLVRLGRTEDAIVSAERAVALNRFHEQAHYLLGNGYARESYTQLAARLGDGFATLMSDVRRASDAFDRGDFDSSLAVSLTVLERCPQLGRAHAIAAKALESQRLRVDVHRADYERRFKALPMPVIPAIETYVTNWRDLSPRHQKRVALSVAPWKAFIPVLVEGGARHYIKPMWMRLSETPQAQALKDARIEYDSRLWDDVRGMGGHYTVTGIEDVERSIFDRYNTVLHELTHQVHGVLTADQQRSIEALYQQAKARDSKTQNAFLSRYAGGSVWEYFAEGANAEASPRRDAYDGREIVRERLAEVDPGLHKAVQRLHAQVDTRPSLPIALVNAGQQLLEDGKLPQAKAMFDRAAKLAPTDETVLLAQLRVRAIEGAAADELADQALALHPGSGTLRVAIADAYWHAGRPLKEVVKWLVAEVDKVEGEDRARVQLALGGHLRQLARIDDALAAYDAVLAYQRDMPEALWGRAATLALTSKWRASIADYEAALRLRTGLVPLRRDYALDLLRSRRNEAARAQIKDILLLDPNDPETLALKGWLALVDGDAEAALRDTQEALRLGPWSDLALIVQAAVLRKLDRPEEAAAVVAPVRERVAKQTPPQYIYRPEKSGWFSVHQVPAVERFVMDYLLR